MSSSTLLWRPPTDADLPALVALLEACEAADRTREHFAVEDLAELLADPSTDRERDWVVLNDGDRVVGYGQLTANSTVTDLDRISVYGAVHPDRRRCGLGAEMLAWSLRRADELHGRHPDVPGLVEVRGIDTNAGERALLGSAGFRPTRHWYDMERSLASPVDPPTGVAITPYDAARDDQVRLAHNETFAHHWGSLHRDEDSWRHHFTGSRAFRAAQSALVLDGDEIAAYVLAYHFDADTTATGIRELWIGQLGTRPAWRGRGYASALLAWSQAAGRGAGYDRAALGVDTQNATGALGLYERAGFAVELSWTSWTRNL